MVITRPAPSVAPAGPKLWVSGLWQVSQSGSYHPVKTMASPQSSRGVSIDHISSSGSSLVVIVEHGRFEGGVD